MQIPKGDLNVSIGNVRPRTVTADRRGFTMIELMVTLVIFSMAALFIYEIFITQHHSYLAQQDVSETQQDVRGSLDLLTRDLRSSGFGVPGGGTGITDTTDGDPDSISFSVSPGASTFLMLTPTTATITVHSTEGFAVGMKVNLVSLVDKTLDGGAPYTINAVLSAPPRLDLGGVTPAAKAGDLVVSADSAVAALNAITYALAADASNPGTFLLRRTSTLNGAEVVADHILDLQFQYTMTDGTVVDSVAAADLNNIKMTQVRLTTETVKDVAKVGNVARTRQLTALIRMRNT
jgi:prepilin-type N-terminal cleavage/methylation domain-containing protein